MIKEETPINKKVANEIGRSIVKEAKPPTFHDTSLFDSQLLHGADHSMPDREDDEASTISIALPKTDEEREFITRFKSNFGKMLKKYDYQQTLDEKTDDKASEGALNDLRRRMTKLETMFEHILTKVDKIGSDIMSLKDNSLSSRSF